jgi:hypothetical protein
MAKNFATQVARNDDGKWVGVDGPLHAEDTELLDLLDQDHRQTIDDTLSKLHELPAPPRPENMKDFMANLDETKQTLNTIRTLTKLRATFGTD